MAKGALILGTGRGVVGDLVFKRVNGAQVTAPRTRIVSNPQSSAQAEQRMAGVSPLAKFYSAYSTALERSFEGLRTGASYSAFLKANSKAYKDGPYISKGLSWMPGYLKVSRGSLIPMRYSNTGDAGDDDIVLETLSNINIGDLGYTQATVDNITWGDISSFLIDKLGFQDHDQITLVFSLYDEESGKFLARYSRFFVDTEEAAKYTEFLNSKMPADILKTIQGTTLLTTVFESSSGTKRIAGFAAIHSRYDEAGRSWKRSSQKMILTYVMSAFMTDSVRRQAQSSYMKGAGATPESDVYLNGSDASAVPNGWTAVTEPTTIRTYEGYVYTIVGWQAYQNADAAGDHVCIVRLLTEDGVTLICQTTQQSDETTHGKLVGGALEDNGVIRLGVMTESADGNTYITAADYDNMVQWPALPDTIDSDRALLTEMNFTSQAITRLLTY